MSTVSIDMSKAIELSHSLDPAREEYRMELDTRFTEEWPQFEKYKREDDAWYIISKIVMNTHCGTHIEFPYHHIRGGQDSAEYPLSQLIGEGVVIDISRWRRNNSKITLADLKAVAAGKLRKGDMAFFYTGNDAYYYSDQQHDRPWFTTDCIAWLARDMGIKLMGVDTSGHEVRSEDGAPQPGQPNHELLLGEGVALIEYLKNLDQLLDKRFVAFVLPVMIKGAEAFPVRVVAFEKQGGDEQRD